MKFIENYPQCHWLHKHTPSFLFFSSSSFFLFSPEGLVARVRAGAARAGAATDGHQFDVLAAAGGARRRRLKITAFQRMIRKGSARLSPHALKQIHGNLIVSGIYSHGLQPMQDLLLSCITSFYGSMDYARRLFDEIPSPDLFMHNAMVRGYAHASAPGAAFVVYRRMEVARLRPDGFTFCYLLRAYASLTSSGAGCQVHAVVVKLGFLGDVFVRNALINMYAKCGDLGIAGALLGEAGEQDVVAWSTVIAGHAARGDLDMARRMFDGCRIKDMVCWNMMLGAYAKHGEMKKARELFDSAPEKDVVSWNMIITGAQ